MGLATMPSASEGVLCIILVNTAVPFTLVRYLIQAILLVFGVHLDSPFTSAEPSSHDYEPDSDMAVTPVASYLEEFRTQTPTVRFDSVCKKVKEIEEVAEDGEDEEGQNECPVCLCGFEPESEINHLSCGHLFHKTCLEQWVDYWNITCPLCRTPLMVSQDSSRCWVC